VNHIHLTGSRSRPGGCGCGGGSAGPPCSCGGQECEACTTKTMVRPRFFAGQLLTEDDLEALTTYVVTKQRLHARHLHGAGVVCGLEVVCHPCDRGKIQVQPGYALDCCGNDIVVPCVADLDLLAMIRRLRLDKLGGYDCGDPCEDKGTKKSASMTATDRPAEETVGAMPLPEGVKKTSLRRYCLYVSYCERGTDPVTPYVLDEPCGTGASCEQTRIREGYRFELRCPDNCQPARTILDRVKEHCGDLDEVAKYIYASQSLGLRHAANQKAFQAVRSGAPLRFAEQDKDHLARLQATLTDFIKEYPKPADTDEESAKTDEAKLRGALDAYAGLARLIARASAVEAEGSGVPVARESLKAAQGTLEQAEPLLRTRLSMFERAEDLTVGRAVLDLGRQWTAPNLRAENLHSEASRLFMEGALLSLEIRTQDAKELLQLRQWLLRRLEGGLQTDCGLRDEINAIRILSDSSDEELARAQSRLEDALRRFAMSCLCSVLLPPCPPCDDPAVLLACLTVEDCKVIDICNMERTFVLSWLLMRYWIPWLGEMGELFEKLCCPGACEPDRTEKPMRRTWALAGGLDPVIRRATANPLTQSGEIGRAFRTATPLEFALRYSAPAAESRGTIARLAQLFGRPLVSHPGDLPAAIDSVFVPQGERLADALRSSAPRRVLDDFIDRRVDEIRPMCDMKAITDAVDDRLAFMESSISGVKRELKRRPTATELPDVKAVKLLATANAELKEANKRLEKANEDLTSRVDDLRQRVNSLEEKR
jgi:hypothetical protein